MTMRKGPHSITKNSICDQYKGDLLQDFIDAVADGEITLNIDKVFRLDQIVEAHTYMESNLAKGKLVVEI